MNPCEICKKTDDEKPMCFRGERCCSDGHRKLIVEDHPPQRRW
jgi:hypothetical protein